MNTSVIAGQEIRASVNERALLSTMKHLFKSSFSVIGELMQNARRAGATRVEFAFDSEQRTLRVKDDGIGIEDFGKLIDLCTSGWDGDVQLKDSPFGMGFFSVFFACDHVVVRSKGLRLQACHDDLVSKRSLKVTQDPQPIHKGVLLELVGLVDEIMETAGSRFAGNPTCYKLIEKIEAYALGFPIDVLLNGKSLDRPHAQQNLKGEATRFGFVHVGCVHDNRPISLLCKTNYSGKKDLPQSLYLQGLPINGNGSPSSTMVVHLDGNLFVPQMPDRTSLYNGENDLKELDAAAIQMVRNYLCKQKQLLSPADFVKTHWDVCLHYKVMYLFNDIGIIPINRLKSLLSIGYKLEEQCGAYQLPKSERLATRDDFVNGTIVGWSDVPEGRSESSYWNVLHHVLRQEDIAIVDTAGLDKGHWVFKEVPSCTDFSIEVEVNGVGKESAFFCNPGNSDCEVAIKLVDSVNVSIRSTVNDMLIETLISDETVLVGVVEPDDEKDVGNFIGDDRGIVAYVMRSGKCSFDVPGAMCDFVDGEIGVYDERWHTQSSKEWDGIVNGLRELPLAQSIKLFADDLNVEITDKQLGQLVLLHGATYWDEHRKSYFPRNIAITDIEDGKVWKAFAQKVSALGAITPAALKKAFIAAAGAHKHVGGPEDPRSAVVKAKVSRKKVAP